MPGTLGSVTEVSEGRTETGDEPLLTRSFLLLIMAGTLSMLGFAMTIPLVPRFVEGPLGGDNFAVGVAVGIFSVTGIIFRPLIGRLGDSHGRRFLIVGGCVATGMIVALHGVAGSLAALLGIRLLLGVTQGAFFVGTATLVTDLAPTPRRGEAINYFSVAVYGGLAFGPVLGEVLNDQYGYRWAFLIAGAIQMTGGLVATGLPGWVPRQDSGVAADEDASGLSRLFYMPSVAPGLVLMLGLAAFTALNGFLPLYVDEKNLGSAGAVLLTYGLVVVVTRVLGSKLVDRWGTVRATTVALSGLALGMLMMGLWASTIGLFISAVIVAAGGSFLYPALMTAAVSQAPEAIRAKATSTFTLFFEAAAGIAGPVLGLAAAIGGIRWAFLTAAVFALLGLPLLRAWAARSPDALVAPQR